MPITTNIDVNMTESLDMIDDLSMNLDERVQIMLSPVYHEFPSLANMFFGIPLANLFAAIIVFLIFLLLRQLFTLIIMGTLLRFAKLTKTYYDERVISALKAPLRFAFIIVGAHLFFFADISRD